MAVNGIDTSAASNVASSTKSTNSSSSLDKDSFLKLLVTEMQYQDPLNPSDNTEYMSQLAQFSSLEAMNNLNDSYSNTQAMNLVGQYVIMKPTDSDGNTSYVSGLVDYVTISNGEALISINDKYYSMDDFDSVVDKDYLSYIANKDSEDNETDSDSDDGKTNTD